MPTNNEFRIAVLPGDGIGVEVTEACQAVLAAVQKRVGGFALICESFDAGANCYQARGTDLPNETYRASEAADAILLGAMGLPDVRKTDGTEINPQLDLRFQLELYAGVRPIKSMKGVPSALADPRAADIDMVIIREQTEGLFIDIREPRPENDAEISDRCLITRAGTERVTDFTFKLAAKRNKAGAPRVTCVDKANVLHSMAFFRKVFDERAAGFPDIEADHAYIDALALNLVRKPWEYDVMVAENLLGDIISDLTAGLIGGMGLAPSSDLGDDYGLFQPCHGTAHDIAGQGLANPVAMFLSAAMMLDWLADRHDHQPCRDAAEVLEAAVTDGLAAGDIRPAEFGGPHGTADITKAVMARI